LEQAPATATLQALPLDWDVQRLLHAARTLLEQRVLLLRGGAGASA